MINHFGKIKIVSSFAFTFIPSYDRPQLSLPTDYTQLKIENS